MFDDQPSINQAPVNLPVEPDDMFAGVDGGEAALASKTPDALSTGLLKRKDSAATTAPAPGMARAPEMNVMPTGMEYPTKNPILGKVFLFVILAVLLGGVVFGAWWVYATYFQKTAPASPSQDMTPLPTAPDTNVLPAATETSSTETSMGTESVLATSTDAAVAGMQNDTILFGEPVDTDKDGLDDIREIEVTTDPRNPDTDSDGLSDGDEVLVWKTSPLSPDSDGDSHLDGKEVANGYDPLGPGRLSTSTVPSAATSTN